ncbi:unnamed protein product [Adineta steineri]|uniref:NAD(P)(+)--arginine ADP-ribosyltransferase n=1 Tax=Adineta steineri TaxID=433720 RepID=A0A815TU97_9BILA|nr:unnamed protein product [Adineta steineri]CAF1508665.1 unnamed protein product [Adineta steineri]
MAFVRRGRFVNNYISKVQQDNWNPIFGCKDRDLKSLEEAVESIIPFVDKVMEYAEEAKQKCKKNTKLTINASAAIYLYTMDTPFYEKFNKALRGENPPTLVPWFDFLKLFITALAKLPSHPATVWRGVANISGLDFYNNDMFTWWSVNSCSSRARVAGIFADKKGTLFCINTIYGKDITEYSWNHDEGEIVLTPGTRLCVKDTTFDVDGFSVVHLEECTPIPEGKHIMISYDSNSQETVSKIQHYLQLEYLPLWLNKQKETTNDLKKSLAEGVENAAVVCCFITPNYEKSDFCQLELQYAQKRQKRIIPCMLTDIEGWKSCDWLTPIMKDLAPIDFHNASEPPSMRRKVREMIHRIEDQPPTLQYVPSQVADGSSYIFELVKYGYKRNSRIERFVNPAKSFPIDQSYINLAIVETKDQQEKEKKLRDSQHNDTTMQAFENMHGAKTPVDIKDIFKTCKNQTRNVLVFGRAGIGKSTFCQYVAYQWAISMIWQEYELIALIPLRSLTADRYPLLPAGTNYSLIDVLRKECISFDQYLSEKDEAQLQEQFHSSRILWLLDGYDEIVQNVPTHLKSLLNDQLLKTPHHIITSRPYMNALSHSVQLEITGFTDINISKYVKQFFDQVENEAQNVSAENEKILSFLKRNPRIHGIAHIPINLELICSIWSNTHWSETKTLTMTGLYDEITEWVCRRYLEKQREISTDLLCENNVYKKCKNELAFLERLAFLGMESNTIILDPALLQKAQNETNCSLAENRHLLNIGLLKAFTHYHGTGTRIEAKKDHYFGACQLLSQLADKAATEDVIAALVTKLGDTDNIVSSKAYDALYQIVEKATTKDVIAALLTALGHTDNTARRYACEVLGQMNEKAATNDVIAALITALGDPDNVVRNKACKVLSQMGENAATSDVIVTLMTALENPSNIVRSKACKVLGQMGRKAATNNAITALIVALRDTDSIVRRKACRALGQMGENAATNDVIVTLMTALSDTDNIVRSQACIALGQMGEKVATNDVITALMTALGDANDIVKFEACDALGQMGEKAAMEEVVALLVSKLRDTDWIVRGKACQVLGHLGEEALKTDVVAAVITAMSDMQHYVRQEACKTLGHMGEKAATKETIASLVTKLGDADEIVKFKTCEALGQMGVKAATKDVIAALITALGDAHRIVRRKAYDVLVQMGENAATSDVIAALMIALGDTNNIVRESACELLLQIGEKAAINDVIMALLTELRNTENIVRKSACEVLDRIGEKAATNDVIAALITALGDPDNVVRNRASEVLYHMGQRTATSEVIVAVMAALRSSDNIVRERACVVLGQMGGKGARSNVIAALMTALEDTDNIVRSKACEALGHISGKAARSDVIAALRIALGDTSSIVRFKACGALGQIGENAATNDVIVTLMTALRDTDNIVRNQACIALGQMGEKVATNDVITALMTALEDADWAVRIAVWNALGQMGEKAATEEVVALLMSKLRDTDWIDRRKVCEVLGRIGGKAAASSVIHKLLCIADDDAYVAVEKILVSTISLSNIDSNTVSKLFDFWKQHEWRVRNIPMEKIMEAYKCTKIVEWCPIISLHSLNTGCAVTVVGKTVIIYGNSNPVTFNMPSFTLCDDLVDVFANQSGLAFYLQTSSRNAVSSSKRSLWTVSCENDDKRQRIL